MAMRTLLFTLSMAVFLSAARAQTRDLASTPSATLQAIKNEFTFHPPAAGAAEIPRESPVGEIVKLKPFHVYLSKNPPSSVVRKPKETAPFNLGAERVLWSGHIGSLPAEIGLLKYEELIPFGTPLPKWNLLRIKW